MLGRAFIERFESLGLDATGFDRNTLDITDADAVARGLPHGTRLVINCAAWTDVDRAELEEAAALAVNATGPELLAARAREVGALFVHFSTDYVFAGDGLQPYLVGTPANPINAYGRTKAAGEEAIRATSAEHLIVRTSWLYAPWGRNFVRTIAEAAVTRSSLRVVDDQIGRPSSAVELARTTLALIDAGARGTFHGADGGFCSWYDLATLIAGSVAPTCRVDPCSTADFPRPAARPRYSVLDLTATVALVGKPLPWAESVGHALRAMRRGT